MRQKERNRLRVVVYEAYMAGQARGQKTEVILEGLGKKFHRHPRTIQNWIYDVDKQRNSTQQHVEELRPSDSRKTLTNEEIVAEAARKQEVLKYEDELRDVASRWKSQIWLPSPWLWDITDLHYVLYIDSKNQRTGYKLSEELMSGEESQGHIRHFTASANSVRWEVLEDGSIVLKTAFEYEPFFSHLKSHTEKSPAWGLFAEWKQKGGTYIQLCSALLTKIEQQAKETLKTKSELSWWSIYHDVFCAKDGVLFCGNCKTINSNVFTCPICGDRFQQQEEIGRCIKVA